MTFAESGITASDILELLNMMKNKEITSKAGKKIMEEMPVSDRSPREIAEDLGLIGIVDESEVVSAVEQAIKENPRPLRIIMMVRRLP